MDELVGGNNLTYQITEILGRAIIQGKYADDNLPLTEANLCEKFNVSRTIVREAVKTLAAKNLLFSRQKTGIAIRPASEWNLFDPDILKWLLGSTPHLNIIKQFTQLRLVIEPEVAALAATCQDKTRLNAIHIAAEKMQDAHKKDGDLYDAVSGFYSAIFLAAHNPFFSKLCHIIHTALQFSIQTKKATSPDIDKLFRIYKHITAGNANAARATMNKLLKERLDLIEQELALAN